MCFLPAMPRTLHLIKHGKPRIVPGVPARDWELAGGALAGLPALVARFFAHPGEVVSGEESADDARVRFGNAVNAVMQASPQDTVTRSSRTARSAVCWWPKPTAWTRWNCGGRSACWTL